MIDRERWHEVDRLLGQALELPPEARPGFLDVACTEDPEVRREVERLLAADAVNRTFLEAPIGEVLGFGVQGRDRDKGLGLGPYKLLERLHSGGMGTVYRAVRDDQQFEQQVAIKILRLGLETTEALHRFRAERQILARLKHPNIARLYDGGSTADGRPFLVMELVEGHPIDEFCDRMRLTLESRLALFRKVCDAVHYAHQNLLVHRDLKPDNILVTADGEPKLLDFGIAKQLEPPGERGAPGLTRTGVRPMTPVYASPEQVRGEAITTASDVYALGVLLYQLLAGRSPYRTTTGLPHEVERAVCEQEPERLSAGVVRPEPAVEAWEGAAPAEEIAAARRLRVDALRRCLSGDLENIVAMALRKEPARRYASVAALSQDLEHYLHNQPVAARPDSALYRTGKFLRRHRMGAGAAAGVCLVVLGLLIGLAEQGRRLARERDKARNALSFLVDVFKNADPYKAGGAHLSARDILDRGAEQVRQGLGRQPEVQAALMDAIGQVDVGLGGVREAEPLLTGALALRRRTLGPRAPETLDTLEHLARLRYDQSDFAAAERLLRQALAEKRRKLASDDPALAETLTLLGEVLMTRGVDRAKEAEGLYAEALAIYRQAEGPDGPTVARTRISQAKLEDARGDYGRAESLFREGLAIEKRRLGALDPTYLSHLAGFADVLHDAGKDREAEAGLRQVIGLQERALGTDHPDLALALNSLALLLHVRGEYAQAEALYRRVLAIMRAHYGESTLLASGVLNNLAAAVQAQNRTREAIALHEQCLAVRRKILGDESEEVAQSTLLLAAAHGDLKEYAQAEALAKQALAILTKKLGPDHALVGYPLRELGRLYLFSGRPAAAEPYLRRCLGLRRKTLSPGSPEISKAEVTLGMCLIDLRRFPEAEALLRPAYAQLARTLPASDMRVEEAEQALARLYRAWGRPAPGSPPALKPPKAPSGPAAPATAPAPPARAPR